MERLQTTFSNMTCFRFCGQAFQGTCGQHACFCKKDQDGLHCARPGCARPGFSWQIEGTGIDFCTAWLHLLPYSAPDDLLLLCPQNHIAPSNRGAKGRGDSPRTYSWPSAAPLSRLRLSRLLPSLICSWCCAVAEGACGPRGGRPARDVPAEPPVHGNPVEHGRGCIRQGSRSQAPDRGQLNQQGGHPGGGCIPGRLAGYPQGGSHVPDPRRHAPGARLAFVARERCR